VAASGKRGTIVVSYFAKDCPLFILESKGNDEYETCVEQEEKVIDV